MFIIREKSASERQQYTPVSPAELIPKILDNENLLEHLKAIQAEDTHYLKQGSENYKIIFQSKVQEQGFNFPYQIGTNGNNPNMADEVEVDVLPGDIVVLGTDGIFDNMHRSTFLKCFEAMKGRGEIEPESLARALADEAFRFSLEEGFLSPFTFSALLGVGAFYKGGKSDDITVAVGVVRARGEC